MQRGDTLRESLLGRIATIASKPVCMGFVVCFRNAVISLMQSIKFTAINAPLASMLRKVHRTLSSIIKAEWNNVKSFYKLSYKNCSIKMKGHAIYKM